LRRSSMNANMTGSNTGDPEESADPRTPEQGYMEEDVESFARDVEALLSTCAVGQPWDDGEAVWLNSHMALNDVMGDADVPEECREQVAALVRCQCCGDSHELWDEVGVKSQGELRYEQLMEEWYEKHSYRLEEFDSFLQKYPYLGAAHDFGKELRAGVGSFPSKTVKGELYFRARRIDSGRAYTLEDFIPPDPAKFSVGEGRYNHAGQSVMYLADDKEGAAIECVRQGESRAWVHGFRIRQVDKILDLSDEETWADESMPLLAFGLMHSGAVRQYADRSNSWKPQYFVPRFIADCAREAGFNGILFKSVRHWSSNLVLFSYDPAIIAAEGEPEIVKIQDSKRSDWKYRDSADQTGTPIDALIPMHIDLGSFEGKL
jgi:hypothetical protein